MRGKRSQGGTQHAQHRHQQNPNVNKEERKEVSIIYPTRTTTTKNMDVSRLLSVTFNANGLNTLCKGASRLARL